MNSTKVAVRAAWVTLAFRSSLSAQAFGQAAAATPAGSTTTTKIAVIDIERIAAESNAGKALFSSSESGERQDPGRSREARAGDPGHEHEAQLGDSFPGRQGPSPAGHRAQEDRRAALASGPAAEFEAKRQEGEAKFQESLEPIVRAVATENQIGLIIRATPGLTFVLDPALDISQLVVQKLDSAPPTGGAPQPKQ